MIQLTRLNGEKISLNALYIQQIQSFPDTTITLTNGQLIVVKESESTVVQRAKTFYKEINILSFSKDVEGS